MSTSEIDARRLLCPLPVIRTQQRVKTLQTGDILQVICRDPGVREDIPAWCRINGHEIVEIREEHNDIIVVLRVGDADE